MGKLRERIGSEQGVALVLALIVLLILTALVMAYLSLSAFEPQISRNLADATGARYVAEAGIEFGFDFLANASNWTTLLAGATAANPWVGLPGANNTPLPGLTNASGIFTVSIRNDFQPGDNQITGVTPEAAPDTDTNRRLIMRSVATLGNATRTLSVVVRRSQLPPFPAGLAFPGQEADTNFSGAAFTITGNDTRLDGTAGAGASVLGISVSSVLPAPNPGINESKVENTLSASQRPRVTGKRENPALAGTGTNTIDVNPDLTPAMVSDFIQAVKSAADIVLDSTPANPLSFQNIGSTCAADINSQTCWGTRQNPKIVYIRGTPPDPTSMFQALGVSGNSTGTGILIVDDGDFRITGNFRWEGPIIVTGQYVGLGFLGGGFQEVLGAVIVNETATDEAPGFREGVITGNAKIRYSTEALSLIQNSRKLVTMQSWREE